MHVISGETTIGLFRIG